ncbi:Uncharacterized protein APZ42_030662 [Daphnia magna]|uniref:Uncharacterized protein n=2 Tax=Daphnia magna TaxID=35525 RepID=A0ABR0A2P7_9CRUS|nr:hypothetical protein OUZ56_001432 [Daphnia magna]KZS06150.1 Uncharacterized protein APZ42_030662 [Daphnia magna]
MKFLFIALVAMVTISMAASQMPPPTEVPLPPTGSPSPTGGLRPQPRPPGPRPARLTQNFYRLA